MTLNIIHLMEQILLPIAQKIPQAQVQIQTLTLQIQTETGVPAQMEVQTTMLLAIMLIVTMLYMLPIQMSL